MADNCKINHTICLPICEEDYNEKVHFADQFRRFLDGNYEKFPELFPTNFSEGYQMKDQRISLKTGIIIRRIELRNGASYSVRPSFLMPYMTGRTNDIEKGLFLRKFGVPFWAELPFPVDWILVRIECIGIEMRLVLGVTVL